MCVCVCVCVLVNGKRLHKCKIFKIKLDIKTEITRLAKTDDLYLNKIDAVLIKI